MTVDAFRSKVASLAKSDLDALSDATPIVPDEWDSVDVLDLIAAIDEVFGVTINITELNRCQNVGELQALIGKASAP
jgi:acyl carrier protein